MAARATSSGTISFGLVSIPVKVYAASSVKSVRFNMLHETDKARLKQHYTCSECGETVARNQTVKGYEYSRGQYVVLSDEELKSLEHVADHSIEIAEFIPMGQVDPAHFSKSQLLGPDKGGSKAYQLLCEAMRRSERVALGRFSTRGKQELVLLRPVGDGLMLHGLLYADEVRSFDDIELGDEVVFKDAEVDLAMQLIEQLTNERFEPTRYEDAYRKAVLELVDRKVAGQEIVAVAEPEQREPIIDLVAALKESIAARRPEGEERAAPKAKRARKAVSAGKKSSGAKRRRASSE